MAGRASLDPSIGRDTAGEIKVSTSTPIQINPLDIKSTMVIAGNIKPNLGEKPLFSEEGLVHDTRVTLVDDSGNRLALEEIKREPESQFKLPSVFLTAPKPDAKSSDEKTSSPTIIPEIKKINAAYSQNVEGLVEETLTMWSFLNFKNLGIIQARRADELTSSLALPSGKISFDKTTTLSLNNMESTIPVCIAKIPLTMHVEAKPKELKEAPDDAPGYHLDEVTVSSQFVADILTGTIPPEVKTNWQELILHYQGRGLNPDVDAVVQKSEKLATLETIYALIREIIDEHRRLYEEKKDSSYSTKAENINKALNLAVQREIESSKLGASFDIKTWLVDFEKFLTGGNPSIKKAIETGRKITKLPFFGEVGHTPERYTALVEKIKQTKLHPTPPVTTPAKKAGPPSSSGSSDA